MKCISSIVLTGAVFLALGSWSASAAGAGHWAGIADEVIKEIDNAETLAKAGKTDDAKEAVINSYFGIFEEKKMEIAERSALGMTRVTAVEAMFNDLRKAAGKPGATDLHKLAEPLREALRVDARELDAAKIGPDGVEVTK
jgi:hypothetical protein